VSLLKGTRPKYRNADAPTQNPPRSYRNRYSARGTKFRYGRPWGACPLLYVQVIPGVERVAECLNWGFFRLIIGHLSCDHDTVGERKLDAVEIVIHRRLGVGSLLAEDADRLRNTPGALIRDLHKPPGLDKTQFDHRRDTQRPHGAGRAVKQIWMFHLRRLDDIPVGEHHLHKIDGPVKKTVSERRTLARSPRVAAAGGDAGNSITTGGTSPC